MIDIVSGLPEGTKIYVLVPIARGQEADQEEGSIWIRILPRENTEPYSYYDMI